MLAYLRRRVEARFPESRLSCVGVVFFLRFVCPAIVTPAASDIVLAHPPPLEALRALVLVAKTLQCLANGVVVRSGVLLGACSRACDCHH